MRYCATRKVSSFGNLRTNEVWDSRPDSKSFVATYFPGAHRPDLKAIIAYGDHRRSFRASGRTASETDAEAPPSIDEWENEGRAPSVARSRRWA